MRGKKEKSVWFVKVSGKVVSYLEWKCIYLQSNAMLKPHMFIVNQYGNIDKSLKCNFMYILYLLWTIVLLGVQIIVDGT